MYKPASKKVKQYLTEGDDVIWWCVNILTLTRTPNNGYYLFDIGGAFLNSKRSLESMGDIYIFNNI